MARRIDDDAVKRRIWNIVEKWKYQGRKYDALLLESVIAQIVDTQPTLTPPNGPLTLEQLREMDGEPVWVELYQAWALVEVKQNGSVMFYGNSFSCSYSRTWQVYRFRPYRRPPERQEDT